MIPLIACIVLFLFACIFGIVAEKGDFNYKSIPLVFILSLFLFLHPLIKNETTVYKIVPKKENVFKTENKLFVDFGFTYGAFDVDKTWKKDSINYYLIYEKNIYNFIIEKNISITKIKNEKENK